VATTEVTSWAVDLSTVGPIYPFVGTEMLWFVLGMAFWIGWHVWQIRAENRTFAQDMQRLRDAGDIEAALEGHRMRAIANSPSLTNNHDTPTRPGHPVGAAR
jgi:hypothetical protein